MSISLDSTQLHNLYELLLDLEVNVENSDGDEASAQEAMIDKIKLDIEKLRIQEYKEKEILPPRFYPESYHPEFSNAIAHIQEFKQTEYSSELQTIENVCNLDKDRYPHNSQVFVKNYMSPKTPYMSILLWWGVGRGKTCGAIGIAEQFKDRTKYEKTIIVTSGPTIRQGWKNEIINPNKPKNNQCTSFNYHEELKKIQSHRDQQPKTFKSKQSKVISENYDFYGYIEFSNKFLKLRDKIKAKFHGMENHQASVYLVKKFYSNRVLIIDEAHNTNPNQTSFSSKDPTSSSKTSKEDLRKLSNCLLYIARYSKNLRLVLCTATPMNNTPNDIFWILNLLRLNDGKSPLDETEYINKDEIVTTNKEKQNEFCYCIHSYISYLRGEDPISFPIRLDPSIEIDSSSEINFQWMENIESNSGGIPQFTVSLYKANPYYLYQQTTELTEYLQTIYKEKIPILCRDSMSIWQYSHYLDILRNNESSGFDQIGQQTSLIIFPIEETQGGYGKQGFEEVFETVGEQSGRYQYQKEIEPFLEMNPDEPYQSGLGKVSSKFYNIIHSIIYSEGIVFVYIPKIPEAKTFCMALEVAGYNRYQTTKRISNRFIPSTRMPRRNHLGQIIQDIDDDSAENTPANYLLLTGETPKSVLNDSLQVMNQPQNKLGQQIKIVVASEVAKEGLNFFRIREIHIASPWHHFNRIEQVIGRGLRFCSHKDLDQEERNLTVYLHSSTIPEIISVDPKQPFVDVRNVVNKLKDEDSDNETLSELPNLESLTEQLFALELVSQKDAFNETLDYILQETTDESYYRRAFRKIDKISAMETLLKKSAIDCRLNKYTNLFLSDRWTEDTQTFITSKRTTVNIKPGDTNGSRLCNYGTCNYECFPESAESMDTISRNTYEIEYHGTLLINRILKYCKELFVHKTFYSYEEIMEELQDSFVIQELEDSQDSLDSQELENKQEIEQHVWIALHRLIDPRTITLDKRGREGTIQYREQSSTNNEMYFIWKPTELSDEQLSIHYRKMPLRSDPLSTSLKAKKPSLIIQDTKELQLTPLQEKLVKSMQKSIKKLQKRSGARYTYQQVIFPESLVTQIGTDNMKQLIFSMFMDRFTLNTFFFLLQDYLSYNPKLFYSEFLYKEMIHYLSQNHRIIWNNNWETEVISAYNLEELEEFRDNCRKHFYGFLHIMNGDIEYYRYLTNGQFIQELNIEIIIEKVDSGKEQIEAFKRHYPATKQSTESSIVYMELLIKKGDSEESEREIILKHKQKKIEESLQYKRDKFRGRRVSTYEKQEIISFMKELLIQKEYPLIMNSLMKTISDYSNVQLEIFYEFLVRYNQQNYPEINHFYNLLEVSMNPHIL